MKGVVGKNSLFYGGAVCFSHAETPTDKNSSNSEVLPMVLLIIKLYLKSEKL